ncbi:condensation protein [Methanoplanus sp. FWC-SCC4]|uniref:Condensation protein n=1 Tax=Methanochimaera problematica TaxID=2609417 RepID=A0AA97I471_9EURY|nr:condensation protein [Methanoplanus sp. FWC-SCC4]WOF16199.1 condensation protein [Methanoplanus sp. FWC-SCC4]
MTKNDELKFFPASAFDVFNVYFDRIYDPSMYMLFEFDDKIDEICLENSVLKALVANPYLSSRYVEYDNKPYWEKIEPDKLKDAFEIIYTDNEIQMPLSSLPPSVDVYSGPQVKVILYRKENKSDTVLIGCHHGFADAHGLKDLSEFIFSIYSRTLENAEYIPEYMGWYDKGTGKLLDKFTKEDIKCAIEDEKPFVDRWFFPYNYLNKGGDKRIKYRTFTPERLTAAKKFGKKYNATINDVILGAFFLGVIKIRNNPSDNQEEKTILTSADLRRHLNNTPGYSMENLSIAYDASVTINKGAKLEDIIERIVSVTDYHKSNNLGLGCILFYEEIFSDGLFGVRKFFEEMDNKYTKTGYKNPVFSNVGIINTDNYFSSITDSNKIPTIKNALFLPTICWPPGFLMTLSTYKDSMTIMTGYEEGPYSSAVIEEFLDIVDDYIPK